MDDLLRGSRDIRHALGKTYELIRRFDCHGLERQRTRDLREKLLVRHGRKCAVCGRSGDLQEIQAAHIIPIEEAGRTTTDNLLLMCHEKNTKGAPGCHELFDRGFASVVEVSGARQRWVTGKDSPELRELMLQRRDAHNAATGGIASSTPDGVQALVTRGAWKKALTAVSEVTAACDPEERFRYQLRIVELERRRSARDALERANRILATLSLQNAPVRFLPLYYYEAGYVSFLMGRHKHAFELFEKSRDSVDVSNPEGRRQWVPATALAVRCRFALEGQGVPRDWVAAEFRRATEYIAEASNLHVERWKANLLVHRVQVELVYRDAIGAQSAWEEALRHWQSMSVTTGWDPGFRNTIIGIRGQLLSLTAHNSLDAKRALEMLARALRIQLGSRPRQPEGVRDVLIGTAEMLQLLGKERAAHTVRSVAARVVDGSSWLYPFRGDATELWANTK